MNTIGKTLVILNFLFAVIVGFLLVFDMALRNRWKDAHDALVAEMKTVEGSRESMKRAVAQLVADYKEKQADIEKITLEIKDNEAKRAAKEAEFDAKMLEFQNIANDKTLMVTQIEQTLKRKVEEIALLNSTIKTREESIVRLENESKNLRITAVQYEAMFRAGKIQNENMAAQLQEVTQALHKKEVGVVQSDVMVIRNPNEPNPPAVLINGQIERVDAELVQLSVGSDHGLQKNQTLDVYRLQPEAKYLGMVRIIETSHRNSVGRLVPSGNAAFRTPLRPGDLVTSKLTR